MLTSAMSSAVNSTAISSGMDFNDGISEDETSRIINDDISVNEVMEDVEELFGIKPVMED